MLNISKIAQELDFEEDDVIMLLEMFIESANGSMIELNDAINQNNYDQIKQHAHSIKGSAANIMLDEICNISKEIEEAAINQENIDYQTKYQLLKIALHNIEMAGAA